MATEHVNEDHIREAAYYIWDKEGRPADKADEHWYQALKQLAPAVAHAACAAQASPAATTTKRARKAAAPRKTAKAKA